jgi:hypothetical protein
MYQLYNNVTFGSGVRILRGNDTGSYKTYEQAKAVALYWLKKFPDKVLQNVCIVCTDPFQELEIGRRYDVYKGIVFFPGEPILFDDIEIRETPYKITGIYRGTEKDRKASGYSSNGKVYLIVYSTEGFNSIFGLDYGRRWTYSPLHAETSEKSYVVVGAMVHHYVKWSGSLLYEFDTREEADQRAYEMVLCGWNASTVISGGKREGDDEDEEAYEKPTSNPEERILTDEEIKTIFREYGIY